MFFLEVSGFREYFIAPCYRSCNVSSFYDYLRTSRIVQIRLGRFVYTPLPVPVTLSPSFPLRSPLSNHRHISSTARRPPPPLRRVRVPRDRRSLWGAGCALVEYAGGRSGGETPGGAQVQVHAYRRRQRRRTRRGDEHVERENLWNRGARERSEEESGGAHTRARCAAESGE